MSVTLITLIITIIIALSLFLLLLFSYLYNTAQITISRHFTMVSGHPKTTSSTARRHRGANFAVPRPSVASRIRGVIVRRWMFSISCGFFAWKSRQFWWNPGPTPSAASCDFSVVHVFKVPVPSRVHRQKDEEVDVVGIPVLQQK